MSEIEDKHKAIEDKFRARLALGPPTYPTFIPLDDVYFAQRVEKYVTQYNWLARKDNRFKYTAVDGFMDIHMFDAYDQGVKDYAQYIVDNDLVAKEKRLAVKSNSDRITRYERDLVQYEDLRANFPHLLVDTLVP